MFQQCSKVMFANKVNDTKSATMQGSTILGVVLTPVRYLEMNSFVTSIPVWFVQVSLKDLQKARLIKARGHYLHYQINNLNTEKS